jgi:hypothetical protein
MGHDWLLLNPQSVWVCKNCQARVDLTLQPVKPAVDYLVYARLDTAEGTRLTCEETQVWNIMNS